MQELEIKILEINPEAIITRLKDLGALLEFDHELEAIFWDFPDSRLSSEKKILRLRREGISTSITFKSPKHLEGAKLMEELETQVADPQIMVGILESVGMTQVQRTLKRRIQYLLDETHVVIDYYMDELAAIPPFLEIEAPDMDVLRNTVRRLGFSMDQTSTWNTYDLIRHYVKREG
jgi:predicted adenylyl cyclase CyaB